MSRGATLASIRQMVKANIGDFAGSNPIRDVELNQLISNEQKLLAVEGWSFLDRRWDVPVAPGQQYVKFPTTTAGDPETVVLDINMDKFPMVEVFWNTIYQPVLYGIGEDEYNTINFALGQSSDPIQRWREATNPNEPNDPNQFEVWPVPVSPQTIRFTGQRAIQTMLADDDTADLDDVLLALFTSAKKLSRSKQQDAQVYLAQAQKHLQWLKQSNPSRDVVRTMDGQGDAEWKRQHRLTGMTIIVH